MILGVTDETQVASFPEAGQLRKGAPKPDRGPGKDLNHFRFTSKNAEIVAAFTRAYGAQPRLLDHVYFPYPRILENFDAWCEAWRSGSLDHRCNGRTCVLWQDKAGKFWTPESYAVAHNLDEPFHKPCPGGCKWTGRLKVWLGHPQFVEVAGFSYVTVMTTAKNDVLNMYRELRAITDKRGEDNLMGIRCQLWRQPHMISTPPRQAGGERQRIEKWLIHVGVNATYGLAMLEMMEKQADPRFLLAQRATPYALPAPAETADGELLDEEAEDADEVATARAEADAGRGADLAKLQSRLAALWAEEVQLGKTNPANERALNLAELDYTALVGLGMRVSSRVGALRVGRLDDWAANWARDNELAAPSGTATLVTGAEAPDAVAV